MSSPGPVTDGAPPIAAAEQALADVRRHLFPFRLERWLTLGLVAFLDQCPRGGRAAFNLPGGMGSPEGGGGDMSGAAAWLSAHVLLVSLLAALALAVVVVVAALVLWLHSRAVFVYVDDVATGSADLVRPWREHRRLAGSYFAWSFSLALLALVGLLVLVLAGVAGVLLLVRQGAEGPRLALAIVWGLGLLLVLLVFLLAVSLASLALRDFVAPIQWHSSLACGPAIRLFLQLLRAHPWAFVLYLLLKIVFSMMVGLLTLVAGCLTCCCALLPVIHQTALQPIYYFERAWSLRLLGRLGYARFGA